jgi:hypothetical protein
MSVSSMTDPGPFPGVAAPDDVDPELLALPAPPRARAMATAGVMVGVIALSAMLMWSFRGDFGYWLSGLSGGAPVDLGDAQNLERVPDNGFVTVRGLPRAASAIRFRRLVRGGTYRVYPMMGQPALFVQSFIADGTRVGRRPRHGEYTGRLVSFADARGGYDAIRSFFEREMGVDVPADAYLLMDGERPADYAWVVGLYLLLVAFMVTNGILLYRHLRPVPID